MAGIVTEALSHDERRGERSSTGVHESVTRKRTTLSITGDMEMQQVGTEV